MVDATLHSIGIASPW